MLTKAPTGVVQSRVLSDLLSISRDVERKRVTLLLRPIDAAMTGDIVERDIKTAKAAVGMSKIARVSSEYDVAIALKNAQEEASGAGLVDFTVLVTATVTGDDLDDTAAAITALVSASKLRMRPAYGAQDSAFALALPLGVIPSWQKVWSI